jgi:hypothetical protein
MPKLNESVPASDDKLTIRRETVVNLRKIRTGLRTGMENTTCVPNKSCYIASCITVRSYV